MSLSLCPYPHAWQISTILQVLFLQQPVPDRPMALRLSVPYSAFKALCTLLFPPPLHPPNVLKSSVCVSASPTKLEVIPEKSLGRILFSDIIGIQYIFETLIWMVPWSVCSFNGRFSLSCYLSPLSTACPRSSARTEDWQPAHRKNNTHQGKIMATSVLGWVEKSLESYRPPGIQMPSWPNPGMWFFPSAFLLLDISFFWPQIHDGLQRVSSPKLEPIFFNLPSSVHPGQHRPCWPVAPWSLPKPH